MKHLDSIALVIPSFRCGGAERIVAWLANSWVEGGRSVLLITLDGAQIPPFFPLDDRVVQVTVPMVGVGPAAFLSSVAKFRQLVRARHVKLVVSFVTGANVAATLGLIGTGVPVVIAERDHPRCHRPKGLLAILRPLAYRRARKIVLQSDSFVSLLPKTVRSHAVTIPNPIFPLAAPAPRTEGRFRVCAAGRLVEKKGFSELIAEFGMIAPDFPDWDLIIYGAGPEEARLRRQIDTLGLNERITLPGEVSDLPERLRFVDLFVLSSRYEGFPNALCEAMAAGCAVVARDCPGAIRDIIVSDVNGIIAPGRLADSMVALMKDGALRERLGREARETIVRFAPDTIVSRWEGLLKTLQPIDAAVRGPG